LALLRSIPLLVLQQLAALLPSLRRRSVMGESPGRDHPLRTIVAERLVIQNQ
jgi:hypothetical protein